ncbi:hypothetical protein GCM10022243_33140 [Saccharothrix violaceirubra]|uniref:DUF2127 domain-containing protein n=1 Tax=Saccharothrix violaceirubra TaxID=413306 RepID=A0A7W7T0D0_9PSEU|nr:hypothetical protein [Saccharothrix violaceirubra]MBB4964165.1 hypothetical protein [Saccharothrix violaceirubra]
MRRPDVPIEVFGALAIGAGAALVFVLEGLVLWQVESDPGWLRFPIIVAALELLAVGALLTRVRFARTFASAVFGLIGLVHLLATLNEGPVWLRVLSGLLSAVHVLALVLLNTRSALLHFGGRR